MISVLIKLSTNFVRESRGWRYRVRMADNITGARVHRITPIQRSGWGKKKDKIISFRSVGQFDRSRGFESRNSELNQIETSQVQSLD